MAEEKTKAEVVETAEVAQENMVEIPKQDPQEFLENFNWEKYEQGIERVEDSKLKEFEKLVAENFVDTADEEVVQGTVVYLTEREAIIDINAKSEGVISLNEFRYNPDLKVGDKVEVLIDIREDKSGQLVLSHRKARTIMAWDRVNAAHDKEEVVTAFETHIRGESDAFQVVHRMVRKDGSISWISDRGKVIEFDEQGNPLRMMGAHVDITQEKLYEQRLSSLVNIDPLTGLLNRPALIEKYAQLSLSHGQKAALLFLDLDNFKHVNDHFGHKFGDLVLCYIAGILKKATPDEAAIGRFGGDEFVILYESGDQAALQRICQILLAPFQKPLVLENITLDVGLSIGVCVFNAVSDDFTDVCQKADQAMYKVKKAGKNNVAFWQVS